MAVKCNIKKDDRVEVTTGRSRGKIGKVKKIMAVKDQVRVVVEGVNMVVRHAKAVSAKAVSGKIEKEAPLAVSNVALLCPKCHGATKVGYAFIPPAVGVGKPRKVRVCRKCKEHIDE